MNLKQRAISGVKWSGLSRIFTTLFTFITTAILARILAPSDFGLMGMILIVIGFAQAFADAGISNALIYRQDATDEQLSSLYWLNIIAGVIILLIVLVTKPLIVAYYQEPRISAYISVVAIRFVIIASGQQFRVLLQKELRFRTLSIIEITASSIASIVTVVTAIMGWGIWSLVLRSIVQSIVTSFLFISWAIRSGRLPRLHFNTADLEGYVGFGLYQMGEKAINYLGRNVDSLIIGRFLGAEVLGFYSLAVQLIKFPLSQFNPIITKVAFPTFSKIKEDEVLRRGYLKVISMISTIVFPMMAGMFVVAPLFVEVVYGSTWLPAVDVIRILCIVGMFKAVGNPISSLLLSKGRADIGFYWNIVVAVLMSVTSLIGVNWGIEGVALGTLIVFVLIRFPVGFYMRWVIVKMRANPYLVSLVVPLIGSGIMIAVLWALIPVWTQLTQLVSLICQISLGGLIYALTIYILNKELWVEVKNIMVNRY